MLDENACADGLFRILKIGGQQHERGGLHMIDHGPGRVKPVADQALKLRFHPRLNRSRQINLDADFKARLHRALPASSSASSSTRCAAFSNGMACASRR